MTDKPVSDLRDMLAGMEPVLDLRPYKFATLTSWKMLAALAGFTSRRFALIAEKEGVTQIMPVTTAEKGFLFARITLQVHSALDGVGLTAAVSTALADAGIACNIIAGFHHDHLFVPWDRREEAAEILLDLSHVARR